MDKGARACVCVGGGGGGGVGGEERGSGRERKFPICSIVQSCFERPSYSGKCLSYVCNFRNLLLHEYIAERVLFKNEEER